MLDFAKLLAHHGITISIITTPLNASRFQAMINRSSANSNLKIQLITTRFPCQEARLLEGCENLDTLTSPELLKQFSMATFMLQKLLKKLIVTLEPRACCIVTSNAFLWTTKLALNLDIPRFLFHHVSSFPITCSHSISSSKIDESVDSDTESFQVPDLPDEIVPTRAQIPDVAKRNLNDMKGTVDLMKEAELSAHGVLINSFDEMESMWQKRNLNDIKGTVDLIKEAELSAHGVLINSFDKMESKYADVYRKLVKKVWCVGPVSLCDKDLSDKIDRGHKASIDEHYCLKWLDSMKPSSVMYTCLAASVEYHVTN